eukprot:GHVQ01021751.1.p1 GENE.GHVQ01021751.1~~GHVQ01021751.1.p1  ORF type:complete len:348 (+),score=33.78 GHVQ01021751.1:427-1470(+)
MNKANVQRGGGCAFTCPRLFQISMVILAMVGPVVANDEWNQLVKSVSFVSEQLKSYQPNLQYYAASMATDKIVELLGQATQVIQQEPHLRGSRYTEELEAAGTWFKKQAPPILSTISGRFTRKKTLQDQFASFSDLVDRMSSTLEHSSQAGQLMVHQPDNITKFLDPKDLVESIEKWRVTAELIRDKGETFSYYKAFPPTQIKLLDTAWESSQPEFTYIPKDATQDGEQLIEEHNDVTKKTWREYVEAKLDENAFFQWRDLKRNAKSQADIFKAAYELAAEGDTYLPELKRQLAICAGFAVYHLQELKNEYTDKFPESLESNFAIETDAALNQSKVLLGDFAGANPV